MSEGCKYCRMEENGDIPEDHLDIFDICIGYVFGRGLHIDGMIYKNTLSITENDTIAEIPIKYCPMCGRKL